MKLKTLEQFESKDPCECGGNCGCGGKPVNEKFSFSKKEVEKAANLIASAIAQADMVKTKVHHLEYDKGRGAGFDISIDGEESAGGSYVVKDNGDVVNAAIGNSHPNAVYNTIGNKDIADVFINMEKYESNIANEATVVMDAMDPKSKILKKLLKKHKVTMKVLDPSGPSGWPEVELTGSREDLQAVLASEDGWDDPELGEYIEESNTVTEAKDPYKEIEKAIKGMKGVSADIKGDTIIVSNKAGDEFTYSMNDADDVAEFIATIEESVVTESKEMSKKEVRDLKVKINNARTIGKYFTKDEVEFLQSLFESEVNEAKKYKFKELAKAWEFVYGEDMEDEYEGFYQEVIGKHKNKVTKSDIAEIWSNVYGEDVAAEYGGFFDNLKENVNEATKLEKFNNIEEANADGTISDDEDDAVENMLVDVEYMVDELVNYIKVETEKIGGSFRSPGYEAQCLKLVKETFKKHKVRL
jgi:hypothetical protein